MIDYYLEREEKRLADEIRECQKVLKKSPEGIIRGSTTNGKYVKWYHVVDGVYHTLPKANQKLALALVKKRKAQIQLQGAQSALSALRRYQKARIESSSSLQKFINTKLFQDLVIEKPNECQVQRGPLFREEDLIYVTARGLRVRSKSELIIASALDQHGISYVYEEELLLDGESYQPDFAAVNARTGEKIYWEHFGMMDNSKYVRKAERKLDVYMQNGVTPMINLIVTSETDKRPLDCMLVETLIKHFLE